ncbi:MAG: inositol monophosphatase family protein [Candidatus Kryptoniota bacterium]
MSQKKEFNIELEFALKLAKLSESVTMKYFHSSFRVYYKNDSSPVTIADRKCEKSIKREIKRTFPHHDFYGEEFGESTSDSEYRWIIDPIDGTKNFTRGIPFWGTLIALEYRGEVVVGVVKMPGIKETYYAAKGLGAFLNRKRLKVSKVKDISRAVIVHGGLKYFMGSEHEKRFLELISGAYHDRGFGDCFGYTFVASGRAEAMVDPLIKPWDVAAVKILIEESGGIFSDFKGNKTIYGGTGLAANPYVHEKILKIIG